MTRDTAVMSMSCTSSNCMPLLRCLQRQATHDFELQGHLVPKDTFITMNYSYITSHDDRSVWERCKAPYQHLPCAFA